MNEEFLKKAFARELFGKDEKKEAFTIALEMFGNDVQGALHAAQYWINDPIFIEETERLRNDDKAALDLLPKDAEIFLEILNRSRTCAEDKDSFSFYKLFLEATKRIGSGSTVVNNNNNVTNRVIIIREPASVEEWEKGVLEQQRNLKNASAMH